MMLIQLRVSGVLNGKLQFSLQGIEQMRLLVQFHVSKKRLVVAGIELVIQQLQEQRNDGFTLFIREAAPLAQQLIKLDGVQLVLRSSGFQPISLGDEVFRKPVQQTKRGLAIAVLFLFLFLFLWQRR